MTKKCSTRIDDIYYSALEIKSPGLRKAFLKIACEGDVKLREQVDHLLVLQPEVERFFQKFKAAKRGKISESPFFPQIFNAQYFI